MENFRQQGQCPLVLVWGGAPFAVHQTPQRTVYYPDGMQLEIRLEPDFCLVETIRVVNGQAEHEFSAKQPNVAFGGYHKSRLSAFQQCVSKLSKGNPKRAVIFGPSHHSIQAGILERFQSELTKLQVIGQTNGQRLRMMNRKRVTWGDDHPIVIEQPILPSNKYGGWGLNATKIIPNREQLRSLLLHSDDDDEVDDDFEMVSPSRVTKKRICKKNNIGWKIKLYLPRNVKKETAVVASQPIDKEEKNDNEQPSKCQKISEEEMADRENHRREQSFEQTIDPCATVLPPVGEAEKLLLTTNSTSVGSTLEDEIKEFDQWLLLNEFVM